MILDMIGVRHACIQSCLSGGSALPISDLGPITVYTYGVLLAAAYLLAD